MYWPLFQLCDFVGVEWEMMVTWTFKEKPVLVFQSYIRRRQWHPTPVLLPGESQGRGNLVGCRLWGRTESNTTEAT